MTIRKILNNGVDDAQFRTKGYVKILMLNAPQVASVLADLSKLRPADGFVPDGSGYAANTYHCTFLDTDTAYKTSTFEVLSKHFYEGIERYLADYKIVSANFYIKPPGQGDFPIHQNWPMLDLNKTSVTIWCPLVDVHVNNGTLHVLPGSHKLLPHIEGPNSPAYFSDILPFVQKALKPCAALAGEAIIFDGSLVHGSPPNNSDAPRIAV